MSLYSIIAFNSALDKMKQNNIDSQNIDSARIKNQQAQEDLDTSKKLDLAKTKDARNQGLVSDYVGDKLEENIKNQYKPKEDTLDAVSDKQDLAQHQIQQQNQQLGQVASTLHATDPDVQAHVGNMLQGIRQAQGGSGATTQPSPMAAINPMTSGGQANATGPTPNAALTAPISPGPAGTTVPSIFPMTSQMPSPIENNQQIGVNPAADQSAQATDSEVRNAGVTQQQNATIQSPAPVPQQNQPQNSGGIDMSPIEKAYGMPGGSMWVNPSSGKAEMSPIWQNKMEAQNRAQANYDVNQPFREEQREDKNVKTAESYLVNSLKQRGGAIGLQNNKVDAAIHARALINQSYDPQTGSYNVSQVPFGELSESVGALLSGQSGSSEGRIAALKQKTAQGDVNGVISYFTGKPSNATSQDAIKQLVGIIDRQGEVSEDLRDQAFEKLKGLPTFSRLSPESLDSLKSQHLGNSFKEFMQDAPDKQPVQKQGSQKDYSSLWK